MSAETLRGQTSKKLTYVCWNSTRSNKQKVDICLLKLYAVKQEFEISVIATFYRVAYKNGPLCLIFILFLEQQDNFVDIAD